MQDFSAQLVAAFERSLDRGKVPPNLRQEYHKWLRFYLMFCQKYAYSPALPTSLGPFLTRLAAKHQPIDQRHLAAAAIKLFIRHTCQDKPDTPETGAAETSPVQATQSGHSHEPAGIQVPDTPRDILVPRPPAKDGAATREGPSGGTGPPLAGGRASWEQEYHDLESAIKIRNYSTRTFESYRLWVSKFQAFVRSRATCQLGARDVRNFLSWLAVQRHVSASSQNQAFNSLLFFFRHVLGREFGKIDGVVRAKRHRYIPVVLSRDEVEAVLAHLQPPFRLVVLLLYGCGLRLAECVNLRIHCFNLDAMLLTVHDGKGQKDRTVPLPVRALPEIREEIEYVRS